VLLNWFGGVLLLALVVLAMSVLLWQLLTSTLSGFSDAGLPGWVAAVIVGVTLVALWLVGMPLAGRAAGGALAFCAVLVLGVLLVGIVTDEIGKSLQMRAVPLAEGELWRGLAIAAVTTFVVLWSATSLAWTRYRQRRRWAIIAAVIVVGQVALLGYLTARTPRWEVDPDARAVATRGLGRIDVLLVVDSSDDAGRRIIEDADAMSELIAAVPRETPLLDIRLGVAQLGRSDGRPLYETVLQPTSDRSRFAATLKEIDAEQGAPSYGAWGRVFYDAQRPLGSVRFGGAPTGVDWRDGARRALVFATARPPNAKQLAAAMPDSTTFRRDCARDHPTRQGRAICEILATPESQLTPSFDPSTPVAFSAAVAAYRRGGLLGGSLGALVLRPPEDLSVYLVTTAPVQQRSEWTAWTQATGGRVVDPRPYARQTLVQVVEDAATDAPIAAARDLAYRYRPHLRLHSGEQTRPVDVDALFRPRGERLAADRVCNHRRGKDDCDEIESPFALLRAKDGYIDFRGDARKGWQDGAKDLTSRMYFDMQRNGRELHIGYWWFFPVNVSPVQERRTCLPGLTVRELTCYDHEGDWEGVTVTLGLRDVAGTPTTDPYAPGAYDDRVWIPRSVGYDAHGRTIRWSWAQLVGVGSIASKTHAVVYAARGSHASYPRTCGGESCRQTLANKSLPEGPSDGGSEWTLTDGECSEKHCLLPMPALRRPTPDTPPEKREIDPAGWNAFSGRWGAAVCLPVGQVCSQSDGPETPSRQRRYRHPSSPTPPNAAALAEFQR
jgi:hypothetical protein